MIDDVVRAAHAYAERGTPVASVEFKDFLLEMVASEQVEIDAAIASGATFVRSLNGKIHTLDCPSNGFHPVRRTAYDASSAPDSGPIYFSSGRGLSMPKLMTRQQVEELPTRYVRCRLCQPAVRESAPSLPSPMNYEDLAVQIRRKFERSNSKAQAALVSILQIHVSKSRGRFCAADSEVWPCPTALAIMTAYDVMPGPSVVAKTR